MSRFRVVMVFVLSGVIAYGIWKYYTSNQNIYFQDPVAPVWERVTQELDMKALSQQTGEQRTFLTKLLQRNAISKKVAVKAGALHPDFVTGTLAMSKVLKITKSPLVT
ncbi:MAG: hypothetical protein H6765_07650 [Candidatus Peribacteria bacterium]|nr:MAG: hypothetical protein H6765_07650 [Candidatus Peribacteria bacterium]